MSYDAFDGKTLVSCNGWYSFGGMLFVEVPGCSDLPVVCTASRPGGVAFDGLFNKLSKESIFIPRGGLCENLQAWSGRRLEEGTVKRVVGSQGGEVPGNIIRFIFLLGFS